MKNYGQSIKIIDIILNTYPSTSFFGDTRKDILEKLILKNNLLTIAIMGLKNIDHINQNKLPLPTIHKHLY